MTFFTDGVARALGPTAHPTVLSATFDLMYAYVLAQVVAWLYMYTHRGLSYSRNLAHSIILLAMIVTSVMLVIGDSVARAFGLVGALAIIRFRTVIRDARDTTFIFLALAVGIAVGVGQHALALCAVVVIGGVSAWLHYTGFAHRHSDAGVLRVRSTSEADTIDEAMAAWCASHELLSLREVSGGESEYSYEIRLYDPTERDQLVAAVQAVPGTSRVTIALEERAEEW